MQVSIEMTYDSNAKIIVKNGTTSNLELYFDDFRIFDIKNAQGY